MMNYLIKMNVDMRVALCLALEIAMFVLMVTIHPLIGLLGFVPLAMLLYINSQAAKFKVKEWANLIPTALRNNDFVADDSQLDYGMMKAIAISEKSEEVAIMTRIKDGEDFKLTKVPFSKIIESSIKQDSVTITKSSMGAMVAGGALAGVGGALLGSTLRKSSMDSMHKLTLTIIIDDFKNPVFSIDIVKNDIAVSAGSEIYENAWRIGNKWHGMMEVIMKRNENNNKN